MTENQIRIAYQVRHLRYKYRDNPTANAQLDRILWYSYPVVYPDWDSENKLIAKAINARKQRIKRARRFLRDMADFYGADKLHFVTLTFTDEVLKNTSAKTRHEYVTGFLHEQCMAYHTNLDYGSKNEREHYHAVVKLRNDSLALWPYGFSHIVPVRTSKKGRGDINSISTYMNKLVNHSGKLTTGRCSRSRGFDGDGSEELPF